MRVNWKLTLLLSIPLAAGALLWPAKTKRNRSIVPLQSGVLPKFASIGNGVESMAFAPDSRTLALSDTQNQIHLWNISARQFEQSYRIPYQYKSLQWSENLLTSTGPNSCRRFQFETGKTMLEFPTQAQSKLPRFKFERYNQVAASPDASTVAFAQIDGRVSVWNARAGTLRSQFKTPNRENCGLALSEDAKTVAVGYFVLKSRVRGSYPDKIATEIELRDTYTGKLRRTLNWNESAIERVISFDGNLGDLGLAFSPDGESLVAASPTGIRVWDIGTGKIMFDSAQDDRFRFGGEKQVYFSPDGSHIAGFWGNSIGVWSAKKGELAQVFRTQNMTQALAFSPNSKQLASGGQNGDGNGVFQIWNVSDLK